MNDIKRPKVAIIGTGNVGSTFAFALMSSGLAQEIVLVDRNQKKAEGEVMDLNHGLSFVPPVEIYSASYEGCKDADIVVITAGAKQKSGQSRVDLVQTNTEIFKEMIPQITKHAPDAILLVVSNPVDILSYITLKISGFEKNKVIGSGTVLDTSRFRYMISEHCQVDARNVHAYIIGEHGDTELPVWSCANIGGMPLDKYCPTCKDYDCCRREEELSGIFEEVKNAAYKIIDSKGATYYAIGLALVRIVAAILRDEDSVLPVSSLIEDYYGIKDVYLGAPCILNKRGIEQMLRLELSRKEQKQLQASAKTLKDIIKQINL